MYHYDQLNRLRAARAYTGLDVNNTWNGVADAVANRYRSMYEYDANGNITGAARFDGSGNWYDYLHYKYQKNGPRLRRNRLYQLNDLADQANAYVNETGGAQDIAWTDDVPFDEEDADMNTAYNYGYDALGNLVRDDREHIDAIDWTVAGKVKRVQHATGEGPELNFAYGASGQRVMKQVGEPGTDAGAYREHYIRDAQGNIMATYRYTNITAASLELNERPIYGSSRLGSYAKTMQLYNAQAITSYPPPSNIIQRPHLRYELTDHLGNVAAVVTGRLLPSQSLAPFEADLVSAQGYEPFGSLLPGRNFSSNSYRHGFNGMEKDDEMHGATGTSYDFGARLYDPRVGRWLSLDPDRGRYPSHSPYSFAINSPMWVMDPDGKRVFFFNKAEAEKAAADLNRLYAKQYGVSNALTTVTKDITIQSKNPAYGFLDWIGIGDEPEFIEQKMAVTYVVTNPDFNWNTDEYTKATFDVLNVNFDIVGDIIPDNGEEYKKLEKVTIAGLLADFGGGKTLSSNKFVLSDALNEYGKGGESTGGVMLHELLYHLHPLGQKEATLPGSSNRMKDKYNLPRGTHHVPKDFGIGTRWPAAERSRLDQERAKTGPKKTD